MPTIRDVAERAGVSVATVSAVINNNRPVSARLRRRVEEAIAELDYRPNLVARALFTKRTQSLGFLIPSIANPFFASMVQAAERAAHKKGYAVFVGNTDGDIDKANAYGERLLSMGVDGVMATLTWDIVESELVETLRQKKVPFVGVAGGRPLPDSDCFVSDDEAAGTLAGRYPIGLGHRHIAFVGAPNSRTTELRSYGVQQALVEAGISVDPRLTVQAEGYAEEDAGRAVLQLLSHGVPFTAVVAFNDVMGIGVLTALETQGLSVPQHISVVGFDDTVSVYARPRLTTVACPKVSLAQLATERLIELIEKGHTEPAVQRLPVQLIVRESTRAVPAAMSL